MTGQQGEGGGRGWGGGEYDSECLFDDDHFNDEYDEDNEYNGMEDGKGSRGGADNGGESNYDGRDVIRGLSFGGVGHRTSIVGPHAAAAIINKDDNNNHRRGGGASCPPPPVRPIPPDAARHCRCRRPRSTAAARGRLGCGHMHGRWEEVGAVVLVCQVLNHPGVDDGGKRSGVTSVGLRGSQRQAGEGGGGGCAARATATTATATEEGGGEREGRRGRGLLSGPCHGSYYHSQ
jgi:hypothetical protein